MPRRKRGGQWVPRITVFPKPGKKVWYFRWRDKAGRRPEEASKVPIDKPISDAIKAAGVREGELASAGGVGVIEFNAAADRFQQQHMDGLAAKSRKAWTTTRNHVSRVIQPKWLTDLDETAIDTLQAALKKEKCAPTSIGSYMRQLKVFLRWAKRKKLLAECPNIDMPANCNNRRRSREINGEELDRIIMAAKLVRPNDYPRWVRAIEGLSLSGLRIEELVSLRWSDGPNHIDLTGEFPGFQIDKQKNGESQWVPMLPEFYLELVDPIPEDRRIGYVFPLPCRKGPQMMVSPATRTINDIGRRSLVKTGEKKFATTHDIGRRAFATALAGRLSQWQLATIMRHKSPATTDTFYVGDQGRQIAALLWGDQMGDLPKKNSQVVKDRKSL